MTINAPQTAGVCYKNTRKSKILFLPNYLARKRRRWCIRQIYIHVYLCCVCYIVFGSSTRIIGRYTRRQDTMVDDMRISQTQIVGFFPMYIRHNYRTVHCTIIVGTNVTSETRNVKLEPYLSNKNFPNVWGKGKEWRADIWYMRYMTIDRARCGFSTLETV